MNRIKNQIFPVFNPESGKFLFNEKRYLIHSKGYWHKAIQANVIRKKGDSFEILMQKRSDKVDIGKEKYDQSLATQMLATDNFSEENTLHRGLLGELGINSYIRKVKMQTEMHIIKTYEDDFSKINRELLSLFILEVSPNTNIKLHSTKIRSIEWVRWEKFLDLIERNSNSFTKTAQFYFGTKIIRKEIEVLSFQLIQGENKRIKPTNKLYLHINERGKKPKTVKTRR